MRHSIRLVLIIALTCSGCATYTWKPMPASELNGLTQGWHKPQPMQLIVPAAAPAPSNCVPRNQFGAYGNYCN